MRFLWSAEDIWDKVLAMSHVSWLNASERSDHTQSHCACYQCITFTVLYCTLVRSLIHCTLVVPSVLWRCWLGGRKGIRPEKTEWWVADMVTCLQRGADLHMAQLMPLPLTVSCFSEIQIGFTFLVLAHLGSPRKRAVKWVRVCVCVCALVRSTCTYKWIRKTLQYLLNVVLVRQWPAGGLWSTELLKFPVSC